MCSCWKSGAASRVTGGRETTADALSSIRTKANTNATAVTAEKRFERLRRPFATAVMEALLWLVPAALFLRLYMERAAVSLSAAWAHLGFLLIFAGSVAATRALLHRFVRRAWSGVLGALLTAGALWVLWTYYVIAIAGYGAWGRLVSWGLIETYLWRATELFEVLGPGASMVLVAAGMSFIGLSWLIHRFLVAHDWTAPARGNPSRRGAHLSGATLFLCAAAIFFWRFVNFPPVEAGEPVASTFNTHLLAQRRQTHHSPMSQRLALREEHARAAYVADSRPRTTNIVVVVVDALRAKSMGVYGYERNTTPFLSQLAREGKIGVVPHAYSVCAESSCGIYGILASRQVHQAVSKPITVIDVLRRHGYDTHLLLSGDHTNFYDLRQVYGTVDTYFDSSSDSGGLINDDSSVIEQLEKLRLRRVDRNFFHFHLMANHVLGRRTLAESEPFGPTKSYYAATSEFRLAEPTAAEMSHFVNYYDTGVLQADTHIRRLMEALERKGVLRDALVIVTADHGELVGERGLFGHAKTLREAVIRIPLLVMRTGLAGRQVAANRTTASQVDIAPTVLEALQMPIPETWQGKPLQHALAVDEVPSIISQQAGEVALITPGSSAATMMKFVVDIRYRSESAYDVAQDPDERRDLLPTLSPQQAQGWRTRLLDAEAHARETAGRR